MAGEQQLKTNLEVKTSHVTTTSYITTEATVAYFEFNISLFCGTSINMVQRAFIHELLNM